jgi:hypothetical protein
MRDLNFVCAECDNEQDSMDRNCDKCGSVRVVQVSVIEQLFGNDWRSNFQKAE